MSIITIGVVWKPLVGAVNIYCGKGSPLGNPYAFKGMNPIQRDEACEQFDVLLNAEIKNTNSSMYSELIRIYKILKADQAVNLQCYCEGKRCHCESIKRVLDHAVNKNI